MIRLQGLTEKIHPQDWPNFMRSVKRCASREQNQTRLVSAKAQPILLKFCGLFRGNSARPCSITMPANFAPEKVIHQRQRGNFASKREQRGTRFPLPSGSKLARGNVTDKNHHGSFPYQFLSRQAESQIKNENSGRSRPLIFVLHCFMRTTSME